MDEVIAVGKFSTGILILSFALSFWMYRQNKAHQGVTEWFYCSAFLFLHGALIAALSTSPIDQSSPFFAFFSYLLPNLVLTLAAAFLALGYGKFLNQSHFLIKIQPYLFVIIAISLIYYSCISPSMTARMWIVRISLSFQFCSSVYLLQKYATSEYYFSRYLSQFALVTSSANLLVGLVLYQPNAGPLLQSPLLLYMAYTNLTLTHYLLVFGFALMCIEKTNNQLAKLSETDPLTGIFNRRGWQQSIDQLTRHQHAAMMVIDLDYFKQLNDAYGHQAGDEVLKGVTNMMNACMPEGAIIGRIGGEEFAIYLPETTLGEAQKLANALRLAVSGFATVIDSQVVQITTSIGVASTKDVIAVPELHKKADSALYLAKQSGRNTVRVA